MTLVDEAIYLDRMGLTVNNVCKGVFTQHMYLYMSLPQFGPAANRCIYNNQSRPLEGSTAPGVNLRSSVDVRPLWPQRRTTGEEKCADHSPFRMT